VLNITEGRTESLYWVENRHLIMCNHPDAGQRHEAGWQEVPAARGADPVTFRYLFLRSEVIRVALMNDESRGLGSPK